MGKQVIDRGLGGLLSAANTGLQQGDQGKADYLNAALQGLSRGSSGAMTGRHKESTHMSNSEEEWVPPGLRQLMPLKRAFDRFWERHAGKITLVIVGLTSIIGGLTLASPWLDTLDVERWECEVVSAEVYRSSGGLGGSASSTGVRVLTKDCGSIDLIGPKVPWDKQEAVAQSMHPGDQLTIDVGWYSRTFFASRGAPTTANDFWVTKANTK